jgi:hypothetical protein
MRSNSAVKPSFLDEVEEEMDQGAKGGEDAYGADMEDEEEDEEMDAEAADEDRILAAKQVAKALGITVADPKRFADSLRTFIRAC